MALNLADGQLAASSATILGPATAERTVAITCFNTAAQEQTVVFTMTRSGSSARTIARAVLEQYEALYLEGVQMDPSDLLAGYATGASAVDYVASLSTKPFSITVREATGAPKVSQVVTVTLPENLGLTAGEVEITGLLGQMVELLQKIA